MAPCQIAVMSATGHNQHDIITYQRLSNQKPAWQSVTRKEDEQAGP